jgi:hypothetical protein
VRRAAARDLAEGGVTWGKNGVTVSRGSFYKGSMGWGTGGGGHHMAIESRGVPV